MSASAVLGALLVIAFGLLGVAKIAAVSAMRERAAHVGYSVEAYRRIGVLEALAAVGIAVGFAAPVIGLLSAAGLLLLLGGAVTVHLRNGDGPKELAPAVVLGAMAVAFVVLGMGAL